MKNSDGPLISIIIHSFDRFEYLLNAIESIKNQTYKNYELILINDDSNEKELVPCEFAEALVRLCAKKYARGQLPARLESLLQLAINKMVKNDKIVNFNLVMRSSNSINQIYMSY